MTTLVVDTNIFLRFLLKDIPKQYNESEKLFKEAKGEKVELVVPQIVVFEVEFALSKYYHFLRGEIVDKVRSLINTQYLQIQDKEIFLGAVELYRRSTVSFTDCFLIAKAKLLGAEIFSFDKDLNKLFT